MDASLLIADVGQPQWPGWQIIFFLIFVSIGYSFWADPSNFIRAPRAPSVRVVRTQGARD